MATARVGTAAKVAVGFVLGAVMAVFLPPVAFAIALVLGGVVVWSSMRGDSEQQMLTPLAAGYVAAVAAYVALVVVAAVG